MGHFTGGLGLVTVMTSMFFAAISGSGPATTAAVGGIMIPAMEKNNYDKKFATALTATAGALGPLIPPSVLFVTFGVATGVSIGALFMSGVIPGILVAAAIAAVVYVTSKRHGFVGTDAKFSWKNVFHATKNAIWVIFMPLIVLGGIYGGIFTPTEAAVIATVYGLVLGFFVYKELTIKDLPKIFVDSALTSAMVMFVIACAQAFSWMMSSYRVTNAIAAAVLAITTSDVAAYYDADRYASGSFWLLYGCQSLPGSRDASLGRKPLCGMRVDETEDFGGVESADSNFGGVCSSYTSCYFC